MKALFSALVVMVAISFAANVVLNDFYQSSSATAYTTKGARIGETH